MSDLFRPNNSNNYVFPTLPACAGDSDQLTLEFLNGKQIGVVDQNNIISSFFLGDISQSIDSWVQQSKVLYPGEIAFIPGLSKGLENGYQYFPFTGDVVYSGPNNVMYMTVDMSINYYNNFRTNTLSLSISSDPTFMVNIYNAINMKFGELGININCAYDVSALKFTGTREGYAFEITNLDVSIWEPDSSILSETLEEDMSKRIPYFKYPNTAMLGYMLKVIYPEDTNSEDNWVNVNHVPNYIDYYEAIDSSTYSRTSKILDVGLSGSSLDASIMSASEYLDWITVNNKWEKVGQFRGWLTAPDPIQSSQTNLINGFYIYNPQQYNVKIEYLIVE